MSRLNDKDWENIFRHLASGKPIPKPAQLQ